MRESFTKDKMKKYAKNLFYVLAYLWGVVTSYGIGNTILSMGFFSSAGTGRPQRSIFSVIPDYLLHIILMLFAVSFAICLIFYFCKECAILIAFITNILIFIAGIIASIGIGPYEFIGKRPRPYILYLYNQLGFYSCLVFLLLLFMKKQLFKNKGGLIKKVFFMSFIPSLFFLFLNL